MDILTLGVVGAGGNATALHLPCLSKLAKEGVLNLHTLCDLDLTRAEAARDTFGFTRAVRHFDDILNTPEIQGVILLGTAQMHYDLGLRALQSGRSIFVEKPPSPTSAQALELARTAREMGVLAFVGFNRRFSTAGLALRRLGVDPAEIRSAEAVFDKPSLDAPLRYGAKTWLTSNSIHALDFLVHAFGGLPERLFSSCNAVGGEVPANFAALLQWEGGGFATFSANNTGGGRREYYAFHLPAKTVTWTDNELRIQAQGRPAEQSPATSSMEDFGILGGFQAFAESWRALGTEKLVDPAEGMISAAGVLRMAELIEEGKSTDLDWGAFYGDLLHPPTAAAATPVKTTPISVIRPLNASGQEAILMLNADQMTDQIARLSERYRVLLPPDLERLDELGLPGPEAVVAVVTGGAAKGPDSALLQKLTGLRVLAVVGASVSRFGAREVLEKGIPIVNADQAYADAVAEFCLMAALMGIRNVVASRDNMTVPRLIPRQYLLPGGLDGKLGKVASQVSPAKFPVRVSRALWRRMVRLGLTLSPADAWSSARGIPGARGSRYNLQGRTVGIIGWGAIAQKFLELLRPFDCKVFIHSRYLTAKTAAELGARACTLPEALACNIVSLHRGLTPATRHCIGKPELDSLKAGTVLINTARGELIDEAALIERLKRGDITAFLDVFETEPLPLESPLRRLPAAYITPHISGSTLQMYESARRELVNSLLAYLAGEPCPMLITSLAEVENMT